MGCDEGRRANSEMRRRSYRSTTSFTRATLDLDPEPALGQKKVLLHTLKPVNQRAQAQIHLLNHAIISTKIELQSPNRQKVSRFQVMMAGA